jgi:FAD/FMN-containing dehydrogenase
LSGEPTVRLEEDFAEFRPARVDAPLGDFSGLRAGAPGYVEVAPRNAGSAQRILQTALAQGVPLRLRAQGHSLNGASLPRPGELLFSARNLRHVRFDRPGAVTAGAGVVLWILQYLLRRHGFDLPVLNDGYPGPSVGGYLAAGGFGPRSARYGGFWDNVLEVRLLDGRGDIQRVTAEDPRFPWLFGAMGQLGIVLDATLAIVPMQPQAAPPYPEGRALIAPQLAPPKIPPEYATEVDESLFWFTLFVPDERLEEAQRALTALERRHAGALRFQERYRYPIALRRWLPPLIYPEARPITATGAWGWLRDKSASGMARLHEFDGDFMALAEGDPAFRRYVQSELPGAPEVYARCFGAHPLAALRRLKDELDPRQTFNRGSVFPAAG